jgi:phage/plasmid primase-like uncharacterized protein
MTIADLTNGRWPDLLAQLAGLTSDQLTDKHQPCPLCGGKDRYRFDDQDGTGSWYCNQCGGKDQSGGGGTGMDMLMRRNGWAYPEACQRIEQHLGHMPEPPTQTRQSHIGNTAAPSLRRTDRQADGKSILPLWFNGDANGYGKRRQHLARYMASSS